MSRISSQAAIAGSGLQADRMFFIARRHIRRRPILSRTPTDLSGCRKRVLPGPWLTRLRPISSPSWRRSRGPLAVQCIQEKAPTPAWTTKPSWYLIAEEDRMILPETQWFMADRMGATIRSHTVDHSPMYKAPDLVVDMMVEAACQNAARCARE